MKKRKDEFADDTMMRELHRVRAEHHRRTRGLSSAAYAEQVEKEAAVFLEKNGFHFHRKPDGTEVIARTAKKRKRAH